MGISRLNGTTGRCIRPDNRIGFTAYSLWNLSGKRRHGTLSGENGRGYIICDGRMAFSVAYTYHRTLADITESTLTTDVATPCQLKDTSWIKPGNASWIYWAHNHGARNCALLKQYVDLAASMLIDAEWDQMTGGTIEDVLAYAHSKDIRPILWYNSTTNWIEGAPTPLYRLNKATDREKEFAWLEKQGVKGVKVDFFPTDTQQAINYYFDLLEDAARHHLLVNLHGGTLPWGWQRTYPQLITLESVYGAEWYNNNERLTSRAACHNATLPFTRNVIGSMDYTPGTFSDSQHPHITSYGHELALPILFESGIQHMPDRPETYQSLPDEVKQLLSTLPTAWDDTRLLCGYPGEHAVLARKKGNTWYIAGINGKDTPAILRFSLQRLSLPQQTAVLSSGTEQMKIIPHRKKSFHRKRDRSSLSGTRWIRNANNPPLTLLIGKTPA